MTVATRTEQRRSFQPPVRLTLLEGDMDAHEIEDNERHSRLEKKLDTMNARLLGVLCSLLVAVVMLSLNLAVMK